MALRYLFIFSLFLTTYLTAFAQHSQRGQSIIGEQDNSQLRGTALNQDGSVLLTLEDSLGGNNFIFAKNRVWVFSGGSWQLSGQLAFDITANRGVFNADGSVVLIADEDAVFDGIGRPGLIGVYARNGGGFTERALLSGSEMFEEFGASIDISADGNRIIVGAPGAVNGGGATVYEWNGSNYLQLGQTIVLPSAGLISSNTGTGVVISDDGSRIGVSSPASSPAGGFFGEGIVRFFELGPGGTWTGQGLDLTGEVLLEGVGDLLAINADASRVATFFFAEGATDVDVEYALRVFDFDGQTYTQVGSDILLPPGAFPNSDGFSDLDLSDDGTRVAFGVGLFGNNQGSEDGFVNSYELTGGEWVEICSLEGDPGSDVALGSDISISGDGRFIAVVDAEEFTPNTGTFAGRSRVYNLDGQTLPVTWLSFTGHRTGKTNLLEWTTAEESANAGFRLERSTDGLRFQEVAWVAAAGAGRVVNRYSAEDEDVDGPVHYYRLRQEDTDGSFDYSAVVTIRDERAQDLLAYPTVAGDGQEITLLTRAEREDLILTDVSGRMVRNAAFSNATNGFTLRLDGLSAGVYLVANLRTGEATRLVKR